ncbi:MAG TPA: hypothetical protein VHA75_14950, partial [Rugosimonospora sp.]|nr:hypothetical protein [Rugosimonospora sp.]
MPLTTPLTGLLPVGAFVALAYALRPTGAVTAPLRLAALRSAVALGAGAVLAVETMSAVGVLTGTGVVALWSATLAAAVAGAVLRYRRDRFPAVPGGVATEPARTLPGGHAPPDGRLA